MWAQVWNYPLNFSGLPAGIKFPTSWILLVASSAVVCSGDPEPPLHSWLKMRLTHMSPVPAGAATVSFMVTVLMVTLESGIL